MAKRIIYRQENRREFEKYWNQYLEKYGTSPFYLLAMMDYYLAYSKHLSADKSFVVVRGDEVEALVFLPVEDEDGERTVSIDWKADSGGATLPAPLFLKRKNLASEVMEEIDKIARAEDIQSIRFRFDPLRPDPYLHNFLMEHGYLDISLYGYLVDCQNIALRRNHERSIRKLDNDPSFQVHIMDKENKAYKTHEQYRELHHKAAGKVTRSRESFDAQYKLLESGNAVLVGLKYRGKYIAFTYFTFAGTGAISFSAADDPEYDELPLYPIINYKALQYLKSKGIKWMDIGQPLTTSPQPFYFPDEKQKSISLFKTGFNGKLIQDFRAIKYFDKEIFERDINEFKEQYAKTL